MKKFCYVFCLCFIMFFLTGCVKFNANMDIKRNKSMNFSVIYAFDSSLVGDEDIFTEEQKSSLTNKGYTIVDYVDGNMKGYTISKKVKNIDEVSSNDEVNYNFSGLLDSSDDAMFKVKKGFLKNSYSAKITFDASATEFDDQLITNEYDENTVDDYDITIGDTLESEWNTNEGGIGANFSDLSDMLDSNMDLSLNVSLPYSAKSNNATTTNNGNKKLSWTLLSDNTQVIEFDFDLYNIGNVCILIGGILLVVVVLIVVLVIKKKSGRKGDSSSNFQNQSVPEITPQMSMQQPIVSDLTQSDNVQSLVPELSQANGLQQSPTQDMSQFGAVQQPDTTTMPSMPQQSIIPNVPQTNANFQSAPLDMQQQTLNVFQPSVNESVLPEIINPIDEQQTSVFGQQPIINQQTPSFGQQPVMDQKSAEVNNGNMMQRLVPEFSAQPIVQEVSDSKTMQTTMPQQPVDNNDLFNNIFNQPMNLNNNVQNNQDNANNGQL